MITYEQIETPEQLIEAIQAGRDLRVDFGDVCENWTVLATGQADDLIAEKSYEMRVWLDRTVMSERLDGPKPSGLDRVGEIERWSGSEWVREPWMIDWDAN